MKCPSCGAENSDDSQYCEVCARPLDTTDSQVSKAPCQPRKPHWEIIVSVTVIMLLLLSLVLYLEFDDEEDEIGTGTIVVTLVNPYQFGATPCDYLVFIDEELEANGTVAVSKAETVEVNLTWAGSERTTLVRIEVSGGSVYPEEKTVVLSPGETEDITFILSSM